MASKEEVEMAYVGGLMDGDGSFSIIKRIENSDYSPLYRAEIQFGSLDKEIVEFLKGKFGGNTNKSGAKINKDGYNRKEFFRWHISGNANSLPFLNHVKKYLVIKNERAEFLFEFINNNPFIRGSNRLSDEKLSSREFCHMKMMEFNHKKNFNQSFSRKTAKFPTEDERFWSYLAGLMDTDGSFSIRKNKPNKNNKNYRYCPMTQLSMKDILALNFIKENCPYGLFKTYKSRTCVSGFMNKWVVQYGEDLISFLNKIIPYLRIKKENAKLLLYFCKNRSIVLHRQAGIPIEEFEFRESCYAKLVNLNKYGVYKPSLIDLEAHNMGDKAEGASHGERLSEKASKEDATV
jgi:hypothetical protein